MSGTPRGETQRQIRQRGLINHLALARNPANHSIRIAINYRPSLAGFIQVTSFDSSCMGGNEIEWLTFGVIEIDKRRVQLSYGCGRTAHAVIGRYILDGLRREDIQFAIIGF
ncbi:MAG: hypothetical protein ABSE48_05990 [Verrucomicrobiota bacterium]